MTCGSCRVTDSETLNHIRPILILDCCITDLIGRSDLGHSSGHCIFRHACKMARPTATEAKQHNDQIWCGHFEDTKTNVFSMTYLPHLDVDVVRGAQLFSVGGLIGSSWIKRHTLMGMSVA